MSSFQTEDGSPKNMLLNQLSKLLSYSWVSLDNLLEGYAKESRYMIDFNVYLLSFFLLWELLQRELNDFDSPDFQPYGLAVSFAGDGYKFVLYA